MATAVRVTQMRCRGAQQQQQQQRCESAPTAPAITQAASARGRVQVMQMLAALLLCLALLPLGGGAAPATASAQQAHRYTSGGARPPASPAAAPKAKPQATGPPPLPVAHRTAILDSHVSVQSIVLQPPAMRKPGGSGGDTLLDREAQALLAFDVALFSVHLSHHFSPTRNLHLKGGGAQNRTEGGGAADDFSSSDLFPEESEGTSEGLTRLVCGEGKQGQGQKQKRLQFFESYPRSAQSAAALAAHRARESQQHDSHSFDPQQRQLSDAHVPDVYLLPLESIDASWVPVAARRGSDAEPEDYVHPLYELLHPLFGSAPEVVSGGTRLRFALLLDMEWIAPDAPGADQADQADADPRMHVAHLFAGLNEEDLLDCSLHFLPESLQTFQPSGLYEDHDDKVLRGSVRFRPAPAAESVALDAADVEAVFQAARRILPPPPHAWVDEEEQDDSLPTVDGGHGSKRAASDASGGADGQHSGPSFVGTNGGPIPGTTSFVATEEHMMIFGELAKSLTTAIIQPAASSIGGSLCGLFFDQVKEKLFQTQEGSLANEVPTQLTRALIPPATYELVTKISETVNAEFPDMLSASLTEAVTPTITETMTAAVTEKLVAQIARSNAFKIGKPLVEMMIPEILLPLGHILTKSLSVGLAPVILHTLDATPHMDYYCYFCATKQLYCAFCSFAPKQIYYSNYYAGYYSTYYAPYYTRFSVDAYQRQRSPLDHAHRPQVLGMPDDGIEIVIPADETMSMWKEEERREGRRHFHPTLRPQESQ